MEKFYVFRNEGLWALQHLPVDDKKLEIAWKDFISGLYKIFGWAFRDSDEKVEIISHDLVKMQLQIGEKIKTVKTISIDPCIKGDIDIRTSRIFLPGGIEDQGIGGRPGFLDISKQISKIPKGEYILIEDDIFSGGTIKNIIKAFLENNVEIKGIICGIQVGNSVLDIPIDSLKNYSKEQVVDLNDPRDFLAGSYGGGLVIKTLTKGLIRVPYVLPFVDSNARSSIPRDKVNLFSKKIWELNLDFWKKFPEIKLFQVEKYFYKALKIWGYSGEETMENVCENILRILETEEIPLDIGDKKGIVFIDLNGTLITLKSHKLNVVEGELRSAVSNLANNGWIVGLCSDSPYEKLKEWGELHNIFGPILSENGRVLDGNPFTKELLPIFKIKGRIIEWAKQFGVAILPEIYAPEFGQKPCGTGIAFGAGRISSVSIFCIVNGFAYLKLAKAIGGYLEWAFPDYSIDCSPKYGFLAIHSGNNFKTIKGKVLRGIGRYLYGKNKKCWHIGDSDSDIVFSPATCNLAVVSNASKKAKMAASFVSKGKYAKGVIEVLRKIK